MEVSHVVFLTLSHIKKDCRKHAVMFPFPIVTQGKSHIWRCADRQGTGLGWLLCLVTAIGKSFINIKLS